MEFTETSNSTLAQYRKTPLREVTRAKRVFKMQSEFDCFLYAAQRNGVILLLPEQLTVIVYDPFYAKYGHMVFGL